MFSVGLFVYPSLFPREVQIQLLAKSFHRDLSVQEHQTNVHMFHHVQYPPNQDSYFAESAKDLTFEPKDDAVHKPITIQQYLNKKLRWITLGGQYDWTRKVYPDGPPPAFPSDMKHLVEDIFPMKAEAAIVNLYSPGDTATVEPGSPLLALKAELEALGHRVTERQLPLKANAVQRVNGRWVGAVDPRSEGLAVAE